MTDKKIILSGLYEGLLVFITIMGTAIFAMINEASNSSGGIGKHTGKK